MPLTIIQTLFKPDGPLARHIDGFKARAPQLEMAEAVSRAIKQGGRLLVEAGTGTGKCTAPGAGFLRHRPAGHGCVAGLAGPTANRR